MGKYFEYLRYVIRHKYFVFVACRKLGVGLWQALFHDFSKFSPSEFIPYAFHFYGKTKGKHKDTAFDFAWLLHQHRNPHHWQFYLLQEDNPTGRYTIQSFGDDHPNMLAQDNYPLLRCEIVYDQDDAIYQKAYDLLSPIVKELNQKPAPLEMPEKYAREMVADWYGAGRAITGKWEAHKWYAENRSKIQLHAETRFLVEKLLNEHKPTFEIMNYPTFEMYLAGRNRE